jgi:RNA polymerase sigma factor (sigma-70 family)
VLLIQNNLIISKQATLDEVVTEPELDELEDSALVKCSQAGDREAFGELVRRHRRQINGYAQTITQEPFLAEDIVQDALIRAFLHLGTLVDIERFLPWLHRIVRNQAYSWLRKSSVARERTFSALQQPKKDSDPVGGDWSSLDAILHRLSRSFAERSAAAANPEELLMRAQLHDMIGSMLLCLNRQERQIFESHFFDHLSPREIAKLFSLSAANVYQILSRSRKKVVQQRVRVVVDRYIMDRKDLGALKTNILAESKTFTDSGTWTSVGWAMYRMLDYTKQQLSLPMVMGLTGHAFRITVCNGDVHIAGPTMYPFEDILPRGLRNIGWRCEIVEGMKPFTELNTNLVDPAVLTVAAKEKRALHEALPEALDLIHRSIDRGIPVLSWDLFIPEFGVIFGYEDEQRRLKAIECVQNDTLSYDHLGRGVLEELFILGLTERIEKDERAMLHDALAMILDHYHGNEAPSDRAERGLRAYDVWIAAFCGGNVEPNGNAYNFAVVQDARVMAARFLAEISAGWHGEAAADGRIRALAAEGAEMYRRIAEQLCELTTLFPFPAGGDPNEPTSRDRAIEVLQAVKALEERAVALLARMREQLL